MKGYSINFNTNWVGSEWSLSNITYYDLDGHTTTNTLDAVSYVFNSDLTTIGDMAFMGSSLKYIVVPQSITAIGSGVFSFCSNLEYITIPNSVLSVGGLSFSDSPNIHAIYTDNVETLSVVLNVNNSNVIPLISKIPDIFEGWVLENNILPITHTNFVYTNSLNEDGTNTNLTFELNKKADRDGVRTVNFVSWDNESVRFYGERGSVYEQGFSEFYGFPSTQIEMSVNGVEQEVVCLPNDNLSPATYNTVSGLVREFTVEDHDNLRRYGGDLSGYSMLGLEGQLNGISGCMSVAIERVVSSRITERISFKGQSVYTNGESFLRVLQIDNGGLFLNGVNTTDIPFNGTIDGLPLIKIGEWFSWSIKIPSNYDNTTLMDFYINNEKTPIQFKAPSLNLATPVNSCVAKLSTWPMSASYSPIGSGCYSYHTNYGITIMKEDVAKTLDNNILSTSDQLFVITPEGNIPVTLNIEDNIEPLKVGTALTIVSNNTPATIDINGNTNFLINGLRKTHIEVWRKMMLEGVNISSNGANYYMDILTPVIP